MTLHATLTDFGLSLIGTKTGQAGSPGYHLPKQLRALKKEIGPPSDVFAFGYVNCHTLPLWPALTPFQIMHKVTVE